MRLGFDLAAAVLLLFCLSYWWLGNVTHEVAGTALFLLLTLHNVFNRRWYANAATRGRQRRGLFNLTATSLLLVAMLVLLVTSVLISNALSSILSAYGGFTVRQIHIAASYWAVILVSIHLELRWPMLMGVARLWFGTTRPSNVRTLTLRLVVAAMAVYGLWGSQTQALGTKLSMPMTLDWWNFEESVASFFLHWLAIAGLFIALSYYAKLGLANVARTRSLRSPVAQEVDQ
ncbi:hypothetical protein HNQ96_004354 [Aminobacter lissarensis]|uniref:Flavinylation-associated cytochrome domain-containing protein n=1 Tax=Aminobacter carboxidus TaxID=376165 RepID=A0A8E1WJF6_9HYPH|nr:DUF4405 domain-containing protein [Aminobacter lissarensis]MBB6468470.1 hypothetical protein [Aminobacter lissarensis]